MSTDATTATGAPVVETTVTPPAQEAPPAQVDPPADVAPPAQEAPVEQPDDTSYTPEEIDALPDPLKRAFKGYQRGFDMKFREAAELRKNMEKAKAELDETRAAFAAEQERFARNATLFETLANTLKGIQPPEEPIDFSAFDAPPEVPPSPFANVSDDDLLDPTVLRAQLDNLWTATHRAAVAPLQQLAKVGKERRDQAEKAKANADRARVSLELRQQYPDFDAHQPKIVEIAKVFADLSPNKQLPEKDIKAVVDLYYRVPEAQRDAAIRFALGGKEPTVQERIQTAMTFLGVQAKPVPSATPAPTAPAPTPVAPAPPVEPVVIKKYNPLGTANKALNGAAIAVTPVTAAQGTAIARAPEHVTGSTGALLAWVEGQPKVKAWLYQNTIPEELEARTKYLLGED